MGAFLTNLPKLDHENLTGKVYRQLRDALLEGAFQPGQRLRINGIAAAFGTSSTPVREAISRLVSERALEATAATAIHVPLTSSARLAEIAIIREHLEGEAAAAAALRVTGAEIDALSQLQDEFILAAARDAEEASKLNRQFHFRVLEISAMPVLTSIVESLWVTTGSHFRLFHARVPVRDLTSKSHHHFGLLAAFGARDADAARKAMQADIRWGALTVGWAKEIEEGREEESSLWDKSGVA